MNTITLTVNTEAVSANVEPRTHLADFLREQRHLTGTHLGCEHGVCGACTLLIDGVPARSCITYAVACDGAVITTIEGLDADEISAELRAAFTREHALQCGYCTPGMLIAARDLVLRLPDANEARIRNAMSGNLCRCTGYVGIVNAIKAVIADRRARGIAPMRGGGRTELGPVGSGHGTTVPIASTLAETPPSTPRTTIAQQSPITFAAGWKPTATFKRAFTVDQPRDKVWDFFNDIESVATCLPGVVLDDNPTDGDIRGRMRVRLGPIAAAFHGVAQVNRNPDDFSGVIEGSGQDERSQSATRGQITYRLFPEQNSTATRVELVIGFALTGMLAQFSRSGLVQSLVDRMIAEFVSNLTAKLDGREKPPSSSGVAGELKLSSLLSTAIWDWLKALRGRFVGRT